MKKTLIMIILLLITTGCTCEYNLKIENGTYNEEVNLIAENSNETESFNKKWEIPIDKDEYNIGLDPDTKYTASGKTYEYNLSGNRLSFTSEFTTSQFLNSSAVSNCYNKLTVTNLSGSTILSTSSNVLCFDKYPTLSSVTVNIIVDRPVESNNADRVNGNTYTWNLTRANAHDKPINLVLNDSDSSINDNPNNTIIDDDVNNRTSRDYTMYIFSGILLIVMLVGYAIVNKLKNKDDSI